MKRDTDKNTFYTKTKKKQKIEKNTTRSTTTGNSNTNNNFNFIREKCDSSQIASADMRCVDVFVVVTSVNSEPQQYIVFVQKRSFIIHSNFIS